METSSDLQLTMFFDYPLPWTWQTF